jgi:predicted TIM-barrel fold metal-dependent hydrolase
MRATLHCLLALLTGAAQAAMPVADMHLHYKWSQQDATTPEAALDALNAQHVVLGVVIGTPAELALALVRRAPERLLAIYSPYREGGDWQRWAYDDGVVGRARSALASGAYQGIGELHLIGGFAPPVSRAHVLHGLLRLAGEFDVPIMLHTEYSRPAPLLELCAQFPDVDIVWAHAGAILAPRDVARVLTECPNVYAGLAARDPWRFVNNPVADQGGRLLPAWRALLIQYPDRFMVGSDPVWPVDQMDAWDRDDTGWHELGRFWDFHRGWLGQLPDSVARRIACENAVRLFDRGGQVSCEAKGDMR